MHRLHVAAPRVFMRMHDVKTASGVPSRANRIQQLVEKSRFFKPMRNLCVAHARQAVLDFLREHVKVVIARQGLNHGHSVMLCATARDGEIAMQHRDFQATWGRIGHQCESS